MSLAVSIITTLLAVGAIIVTALGLNNEWRKRSIVAVLALGAVHIGLLLATDDRASAAIAAIFAAIGTVLSARPVQVALAFFAGTGVGWWLRFRAGDRGRPATADSAALGWPHVKKWMTVVEAIEATTRPEAEHNIKAALDKLDVIEGKLREREKAMPQGYQSLAAFQDNEYIELSRQKSELQMEVLSQKNNILNEFVQKLRDGDLIARGVLYEENNLNDEWVYLKPTNWVILEFDHNNLERAAGGGREYRGIQIGKPETSR